VLDRYLNFSRPQPPSLMTFECECDMCVCVWSVCLPPNARHPNATKNLKQPKKRRIWQNGQGPNLPVAFLFNNSQTQQLFPLSYLVFPVLPTSQTVPLCQELSLAVWACIPPVSTERRTYPSCLCLPIYTTHRTCLGILSFPRTVHCLPAGPLRSQ
jgi:hypothetical protein